MFTGIVEELGTVRATTPIGGAGRRIVIEASEVLSDVTLGASIAVNGCCLTVVDWGDGWWAADAVPETLERTNLGTLEAGSPVNLERPMPASGRFGGHIVQGHVDAVTNVVAVTELDDGSRRCRFSLAPGLTPYVVEKGSITLDGTSLTVAAIDEVGFEVAVIPHTLERTTLSHCTPGSTVNVEVDCIAKYVERLVQTGRIPQPERSPA